MSVDYFEPDIVSLRRLGLDERWLQDRIAENPKLLGLGDLELKGKEWQQPSGGRVDLVLQDPDTLRRYEVEIQLGATDASHIIRTIEYWDNEKRRYPQYDHCAVIVAENVTGRFMNVIALLNRSVPLIALQLSAVRVDDSVGLIFTKVLDEMPLALEEDDEQEVTDRSYWDKKASPETVKLVDRMHDMVDAPGYELKYNKHYIGMAKDGRAKNFIAFIPQTKTLRLHVKLPKTDETTELIDEAGLNMLPYDRLYGQYRIRLREAHVVDDADILTKLMQKAYRNRG